MAGTSRSVLFPKAGPECFAVGQSLPFPPARRGGKMAVPIDVSKTIECLFDEVEFDFVHVHEPYAPSAASAALRHSRALNIGTFHTPSERVLSTQIARRFVELFFGRLDARTCSYELTREAVSFYFPGNYQVVKPGADRLKRATEKESDPLTILFIAEEERQALRLFIRALRRLDLEKEWHAVIWSRHARDLTLRLNRQLRERVSVVGPDDGEQQEYFATADIFCASSSGIAPAPLLVQQARASEAISVCPKLPIYSELLGDGDVGLLFEPGDYPTLAAQLNRLIGDDELRDTLRQQMIREEPSWEHTASRFEEIYRSVADRRHSFERDTAVSKRVTRRQLIHVDLHMHTDHSSDCATPVDLLLETAEKRGLGAIAITDHNEISGALEAQQHAERIKVIVAEEVKTADQGEVIGLFIKEKIARGMSLAETIAEIRRQGGLVYVPHPFDRFHSVPDYEHLLEVVSDIDILEVFNPRIALTSFNEEAERFAAKYRIVAAAGSDSHVAQGLGSVKIRMHDFDGPEEFLESLRRADIVRKHKNLVYVQTLKFLQTTGRPRPARRAAKAKGLTPRKRKSTTGATVRKRRG